MSEKVPDLTLLIPTAGRTRYLAKLFESLALRGDESLEILMGYHGCEPTADVWLTRLPLPPERVRIYSLPPGGGMAANWQAGLERARGRYLFIMGDDDAFSPGGLAVMLAAAAGAKGDVVAFERDIIDAEGKLLPAMTRDHLRCLRGRVQGLQQIKTANAFPTPPFMSSLYLTTWGQGLGFRPEAGGAADIDLFLRAAAVGYNLEVRPGRPVFYRVHAGSYSESSPLVSQALAVLDWNAVNNKGLAKTAGFCREQALLWRGAINALLREGKFGEARMALQREGRRLPWHARVRFALKCRLGIREWRPQRFRSMDSN